MDVKAVRHSAADATKFPGNPVSYYCWTATSAAPNPSHAWWSDFGTGYITYSSKWTALRPRCVRTTALVKVPASRFVVQTETVQDSWTNLEWQRAVVAGTKTWQGAINYCAGLTLAGKSDWRLPNVRELHGIVDKSESLGINPDVFAASPSNFFWSATSHAGVISHGWRVGFFAGGYVQLWEKSSVYYVRCVR